MCEAQMSEKNPVQNPDCSCSPSSTLFSAVRQFNAGEYFSCHETLEELWLAESGALRKLYQGILQVGVGLYHLQRGNEPGAVALLARGAGLLRPFSPLCLGIDVEGLVHGAERVLATLQSLGLERTQALRAGLFPRIRLVGVEERTNSPGREAV
jgi:hypothetical protein